MKTQIPVLILAAGQSSRMRGIDKLTEPVRDVPLLRHAATIALQADIGSVLVALPPSPHPRYDTLADLDVATIPVPDADEGMNASLRRGLAHLPQAEAVMILLADLPDLTAHDIKIVAESVDLEPEFSIWRGATEDGKPGHPVIFSTDLLPDLMALTGDSGAQSVVAKHEDKVQLIPLPGTRARTDLDTPQAWAAWRDAQT